MVRNISATAPTPLFVLFVVLLVLKLTNWAPNLDWFWVWAVLWVPAALVLLVVLAIIIGVVGREFFRGYREARKW